MVDLFLDRPGAASPSAPALIRPCPCLMNNITNILVVFDLIVLQNSNNLLKMNDGFGADLYGKVLHVVWDLLQQLLS